MTALHEITLTACQRTFVVQCQDDTTASLVTIGFGAMQGDSSVSPDITYRVACAPTGHGFSADNGDHSVVLEDAASFIFHLDKDITVDLQRRRADLFFLHAAVVALDGRAVVLSAASGTGKSTFTLALLNNGFEYLSDELAPLDLSTLSVHPYPHALCLKTPPPAPYQLPQQALDVGDAYHLPIGALGVVTHQAPLPVAALVFLKRTPHPQPDPLKRVTQATAAAHLMSNALNALAHSNAGLDAAAALGRRLPCFELDAVNLDAACRTLRLVLADRS